MYAVLPSWLHQSKCGRMKAWLASNSFSIEFAVNSAVEVDGQGLGIVVEEKSALGRIDNRPRSLTGNKVDDRKVQIIPSPVTARIDTDMQIVHGEMQ